MTKPCTVIDSRNRGHLPDKALMRASAGVGVSKGRVVTSVYKIEIMHAMLTLLIVVVLLLQEEITGTSRSLLLLGG